MRGIPFGNDSDPAASFWLIVFLIISAILVYVLNKLTNGFIFAYSRTKINKNLVAFLRHVHAFGALIPAFILPNNYLVRIKSFRILFEQSGMWIAVFVAIIFTILLIILGILLTLVFKNRAVK